MHRKLWFSAVAVVVLCAMPVAQGYAAGVVRPHGQPLATQLTGAGPDTVVAGVPTQFQVLLQLPGAAGTPATAAGSGQQVTIALGNQCAWPPPTRTALLRAP